MIGDNDGHADAEEWPTDYLEGPWTKDREAERQRLGGGSRPLRGELR